MKCDASHFFMDSVDFTSWKLPFCLFLYRSYCFLAEFLYFIFSFFFNFKLEQILVFLIKYNSN